VRHPGRQSRGREGPTGAIAAQGHGQSTHQRRARVAAQLGQGGIAIIPTAPERQRNRDSEFLFRFDSYFHYLSGFGEPNAWLVITGDGHTTLFCNPKDLEREIWDGIRLGPDAASSHLGVDAAFSVAELDQQLPKLLENKATVWYPFATHKGLETRVDGWLNAVRTRVRFGALCPQAQRDLCAILDEMRLIKDAHEQALMRRAAQISAGAHIRAMQRCAAMLRAGQDVREYHLDAELLHEFRQHGSQYPAYSSIVAAGANACVLHYRADTAPIRDGELVLIDAGCELDGYASDITRTFPANGRFTGAQRALYELVLASQGAAIAATKPGARFTDPHEATVKVLTQGMLDLGLLDKDQHGTLDDAIHHRHYFAHYMHRTSHWLGMDVHDVGAYRDLALADKPSRPLRPGMVLPVEPGIYVRPAEGVPEEYWHIGIRIEDHVAVTEDGYRILSSSAPKSVEEIEALVGKGV
jgi:Xaa-Pro aminopeptidase